jgi:hypothetical protein
MFTPAVISLMIANSMAAAGAIFAAWQISAFETARRRQSTAAETPEDAKAHVGFPVQESEIREAA